MEVKCCWIFIRFLSLHCITTFFSSIKTQAPISLPCSSKPNELTKQDPNRSTSYYPFAPDEHGKQEWYLIPRIREKVCWVCFHQLLLFRQLLLAMRWNPGTGGGLHKSFSGISGMKLRSQKLEKISVLSEWVSYYHFASYCWQWGGAAAAVTQRWLSRNNWHLQIYHFLLLSPSWFTILHFHIVSVLLMYKRGKFPFLAFLEEA